MPYEEYDPEKNWIYENYVGRETGMGRGMAGAIGNAEYQQKLQEEANARVSVRTVGNSGGSTTTVSKPWFPAIDAWLERVPKWAYWLLGSVGALIGYGYGQRVGWEPTWIGAAAGGIAGLALLPLCAVAVKLVLTAIMLGVIVGGGYLALKMFGAI